MKAKVFDWLNTLGISLLMAASVVLAQAGNADALTDSHGALMPYPVPHAVQYANAYPEWHLSDGVSAELYPPASPPAARQKFTLRLRLEHTSRFKWRYVDSSWAPDNSPGQIALYDQDYKYLGYANVPPVGWPAIKSAKVVSLASYQPLSTHVQVQIEKPGTYYLQAIYSEKAKISDSQNDPFWLDYETFRSNAIKIVVRDPNVPLKKLADAVQSKRVAAAVYIYKAPTYPYRDRYPLNAGQYSGFAVLSEAAKVIPAGSGAELNIRFTVSRYGSAKYFNPWWSTWCGLPGLIAIYDSSHNYIGRDYVSDFEFHSIGDDDWVYVPIGQSIDGARSVKLDKSGTYYLQAIFTNRFISELHQASALDGDGELFRSNAVKVTVVAAKPQVVEATESWNDRNPQPPADPDLNPEDLPGWAPLSGPSMPDAPYWRDGYPMMHGLYQGHSILTPSASTVASDAPFQADICFVNDGEGDRFYNAFWARQLVVPGAIAVFDENHDYCGNLTSMPVEGFLGEQAGEWTRIPQSSYLGTEVKFLGLHKRTVPGPPETYYLQVIYYNGFIDRDPDKMAAHFDYGELFRSNVAKITLTDPAPSAPPAPDSSKGQATDKGSSTKTIQPVNISLRSGDYRGMFRPNIVKLEATDPALLTTNEGSSINKVSLPTNLTPATLKGGMRG